MAENEEIAAHMDGEFVITEVLNFVKSYMPFEPTDDDVNTFVDSALEKETIMCNADQVLQFTDYTVTPSKYVGTEKACFQPLQAIADGISSAEVLGRTRNKFNFRLCPDSRISADISGLNNMIDACITSDDTKATLTTTGIAVVFEFKTNADKEIENNLQAVSANVQIMNDDARRMFTFGITIVMDKVTLWYHSRSHSAVSESFSLVEDPKLFIKVLMSFLFSTEEELAYDPMVIREPAGTYLFEMREEGKPDRFFRTEHILSEYRSSNITGHMARVWLVGEYSSPTDTGLAKAHHVLKAVWLNASANTEKEIQHSIFKDIKEFFKTPLKGPSTQRIPEAQNPHADYVGKTSKPVALGSKRKTGLFFSEVKAFEVMTRDFAPKRQYRVVFNEICKTVGDLENLGEVVDVLQETLVALQIMYCAGWVHRDISSGNILAFCVAPGKWKAKLSDLEYARTYPPDLHSAVDPKTGTPYFMPIEILDSKYIRSSEYNSTKLRERIIHGGKDPFSTETTQSAPDEVVIYNFQHDLESIWWIIMWTVTCRVAHPPSISFANVVFKNRTSLWSKRRDCILKDISGTLTACLDVSLQHFISPFETARRHMLTYYVLRVIEGKLVDVGTYCGAHILFVFFFQRLKSDELGWRDTPLKTNKLQSSAPAFQDPLQPSMLQLAANALDVPKPGRGKQPRLRKPNADDADYKP